MSRMPSTASHSGENTGDISSLASCSFPSESESLSTRSDKQLIAIVGMAAEFPGAEDTAQLWTALENGLNTLEQIPADRFDASICTDASGATTSARSMNITTGNFIHNADTFDNAFFQISPREARSMDPQQRVLLRVAHNALENAGYCPKATPTFDPENVATFIGVATNDYVQNLRDSVDVYYSTGTLPAFLSGRISYAFGFGGPSVVLDTACSSSLVAIHQACRALAAGDCNAALAGGVNIITSPEMYLGFARGHFLSETGQCRPWDASADGYSRSEGCGVFVLKRLDDAVAENDRILGVIRGTAVNQSGNARSITHPHVPAQTALYQKLVSSADVDPFDISVVECHGTGTQAGDPAELEAIRKVFAVGRAKDNPLHITSIKANIGHAEAASGAASLAKLVLMMQYRSIPRHISFKKLNTRIPDLSIDNVRINTESFPWKPAEGKACLALLTNFGAAGSNCAMILEEHTPPPRIDTSLGSLLLGISCRSAAAAEERRRMYVSHLEQTVHDNASLQDFAYSATARRQLHGYRIAVSGASKEELIANLGNANVVKAGSSDRVIFVFSGQGSQYLGMGSDLYENLPVFARMVDECHEKLVSKGSSGVLHVFKGLPSGREDESVQSQTSQVALFVLEYALAQVWISWGIRPSALVGHSFGEFAALTIAGVLTLDDALHVVTRRAEVITGKCIPHKTGMSSVRGSVDQFTLRIGCVPFSHLEVCCYNSDSSFVIGGNLDELQGFEELCAAQGVRYTRLDIPYAYHSAAMDPVVGDLQDLSGDVTFSAPEIAVLSNATGLLIQPGDLSAFTADYFARHCREPSRFQQGLASLGWHVSLSEVAMFIEVGPHPTTLPLLRGIQTDDTPLLLPSLRRITPGLETLCASLAQLYCTSVPVEWRRVLADLAPGARLVDLPAYPFTQTRFWVPYEENARREKVAPHMAAHPRFSFLDRCVRSASGHSEAAFETDLKTMAELVQGHQVAGIPLCPASVYVELALSASISVLQDRHAWTEGESLDLMRVVYPKPLVYTADRDDRVRVEVSFPEFPGKHAGSFAVFSAPKDGAAGQVFCEGSFKKTTSQARLSKFSYAASTIQREIQAVLGAHPANASETFSTRTIYDLIFPSIVTYSDKYRAVQTITVNALSLSAYALVQLPKDTEASGTFAVHPVFVDVLFHVAGFLVNFTRGMNGRDAYICSRADKVQLLPHALDLSARYGVYAAVTREEEGTVTVDAYALEADDPRGRIVARLKRVRFRIVDLDGFKRVLQDAAGQDSPTVPSREWTLPAPVASSTPKPNTPRDTPRDLERVVLRVISETAGIAEKDVRRDACLAHLGVDSLMLWEIAASLRAAVPGATQELSARRLACATTVGELMQLLKNEDGGALLRTSTEGSVPAPTLSAPTAADSVYVAPAVVDMDAVKEVLSSVLDIPVINISDDAELEVLGLDSLSSIEARHVIQTRLRVRMHEETLFACRTVRDILRALMRGTLPFPITSQSPDASLSNTCTGSRVKEGRQYEQGHELVRIQRAPADGPPTPSLILIHDGSGTIGSYERLAPLGRDVWAVGNADISRFLASPRRAAGGDLVAMAKAYATALASAVFWDEGRGCVKGECCVGGWSFGGVVAYEVARQLGMMGIRVEGLLLIDAPAPQPRSALPDWLIDAVHERLTRARTGPPSTAVPGSGLATTPARPLHGFAAQMRIAARALLAYHPEQVDPAAPALRAVYLRATEPADLAVSASGRGELDAHVRAFLTKQGDEWTLPLWERELGGGKILVLDVPGDHFKVFSRANVDALSEQLKRGLQVLAMN